MQSISFGRLLRKSISCHRIASVFFGSLGQLKKGISVNGLVLLFLLLVPMLVAAQMACPPGYAERTVKCNGKYEVRCVPEDLKCNQCWSVYFEPCPGKTSGGTLWYNSYDAAVTGAQKEPNNWKNGQCHWWDNTQYQIYLNDNKYCSDFPDAEEETSPQVNETLKKVRPFQESFSNELDNHRNFLNGQPFSGDAEYLEYKRLLARAEENFRNFEYMLSNINERFLLQIETAYEELKRLRESLLQAEAKYRNLLKKAKNDGPVGGPDFDGDKVPDQVDKCPETKGSIETGGCPDSDGDKVPDHLDACPKESGDPGNKGCPLPGAPKKSPEVVRGEGDGTETVQGVSFKMIKVQGGTFTMGCTPEQGGDCLEDERPAHQVTLSDYSIGETEVTQALWRAVMGSNPSYFGDCDDCPVERVSWDDAQQFIQKLNGLTGKRYRLPTEAEWEFAARGGTASRGYKYSGSNSIDEVGWYNGNIGNAGGGGWRTHSVKGKKTNELGLYDMSGNVAEWCSDWHGEYSSGSQRNPSGAGSGSYRVVRGGAWASDPEHCRVSFRYRNNTTGVHFLNASYIDVGLRLASQ